MPAETLPHNDSGTTEPVNGRVGLFITCLVDLYRPQVGFAAVRLLERAGYTVEVPAQGCCGQPNFNSGDRAGARKIACGVLKYFADFDYVVAPSGSCAGMLRDYPELFDANSAERRQADALAAKTWELTSFLVDVAGVDEISNRLDARVTYHDGCTGLRALGIATQPRVLLQSVAGLELCEMREPEACCGFGGLFCVKYPDISTRIAASKVRDIVATEANYVAAGDLGCLLQIAGTLERQGSDIKAVHVAELLAQTDDEPAEDGDARDE